MTDDSYLQWCKRTGGSLLVNCSDCLYSYLPFFFNFAGVFLFLYSLGCIFSVEHILSLFCLSNGMMIKVPPSLSGKQVLEMAVTSHILHGHESIANEFASTLKKFPPWIYAHGWTATYSHWSF